MTVRRAQVREVWAETPVLAGARLDAPPDLRAQHTSPGQVIAVLTDDGKKVFLALASVPGDETLELLVAPGAAERLRLAAGRVLEVEGPLGPGFPLESARGKDVLLFAVGSALAPIKPVVELIRRERSDFGRVTLYVGALAEEAFAYRGHYDAWRRDRVDVVKVLDPKWVQDAFAAEPLPLDDSVAYVCGMNEMMDGVTATLGRFGLPPERVHRNW